MSHQIKPNTPSTGLVPVEKPTAPRTWQGVSMLDSEEKIEDFALLIADGLTTKDIAEAWSCTDRTVRTWRKDPRVRTIVDKYIKDRVLRVARKTDSVIEARLQHSEEMSVDELLKIRKEYLGGLLRLQSQMGDADARTISEAQDELERNPNFASDLQKLLAINDK